MKMIIYSLFLSVTIKMLIFVRSLIIGGRHVWLVANNVNNKSILSNHYF